MLKTTALGWIAVGAVCWAQHAPVPVPERDLYLAWHNQTQLFEDSRLVGVLYRGEVVLAAINQNDAQRLVIRQGNRRRDAARESFRTEAEVREYFARRIVDHQSRLEAIDEDTARELKGVWDRHLALTRLRRDSTIYFRTLQPLIIRQPPTAAPSEHATPANGAPTVAAPRIAHAVTPTYRRKLSWTQERRLRKQWEKEIDAAQKQLRTLREKRVSEARKLSSRRVWLEQLLSRFRRFRKAPGTYLFEPHVVVSRIAPLYLDTALRGELNKGQIVLARGVLNDRDWVEVLIGAKRYGSSASAYVSRADWERESTDEKLKLEYELQTLDEELALLQARREFLAAARLELQADSGSTGSYIPLTRLRLTRFGALDFYQLECPGGATEVFDPARAGRALNSWRKSVEELDETIADTRKRVARARKQLVSLETRTAELARRAQRLEAGGHR